MAHILIVDDDQINSKVFAKRLMKKGHSVDLVTGGQLCLDYLERQESLPENFIIILDLVMPNMDGVEVLENIRKEYSTMELPIIMLSGEEQTDKVVECLSKGASDYLTKPANIDIALARIQTQEKLLDLYQGSVKKKQLETINSMVATFNHEINNPLTIALGSLKRDYSKIDEKRIKIAVEALVRIADIVKKIESVTKNGEVEEDIYVSNTKMIKIR
ncbi:MAG: response regulator [Bdellovibrionota bacterium]|nr:response regulator [Bdellovibrionota bacterium]